MAASIANRPGRAGHAEAMLQWVLGLDAVGWDVVLVDILAPELAVDGLGQRCRPADSINLGWLAQTTREAGLDGRWALLVDGEPDVLGMDGAELRRRLDGAVLLDVMGIARDVPLMERPSLRVLIDVDPGYTQMWCELGHVDLLSGYDRFVSVGLCIGQPNSLVPTCGRRWITTPPPVSLARWPVVPALDSPVTSVGSWRGPWGVLEVDGVRLGQRAHALRPLACLPRRCAARLELALDIDASDCADAELLRAGGWRLVDPSRVAGDARAYREYIQRSAAEICVPREIHVRLHSGWFSDRSACYLASGRPVVALDTGFSEHLPVGRGLHAASSLDEISLALHVIRSDPRGESAAAREIAAALLDSRVVMAQLLDALAMA